MESEEDEVGQIQRKNQGHCLQIFTELEVFAETIFYYSIPVLRQRGWLKWFGRVALGNIVESVAKYYVLCELN